MNDKTNIVPQIPKLRSNQYLKTKRFFEHFSIMIHWTELY